jgi:hypothetical protein
MSDQSESDEKSEAESRFEFGKASRRTFLSRLGMASLIASAGSITPRSENVPGKGKNHRLSRRMPSRSRFV